MQVFLDTFFSSRFVEEREVEWSRFWDDHIWILFDFGKYKETPWSRYVLQSPVPCLQMKTHAEKLQFDLDIAWQLENLFTLNLNIFGI